MTDPGLAPEFELFKKDVGEWDAAITITPGPGEPPQASRGRLIGRLISGGRWLVTDFKNHTTGFEGHGIYGYNPASNRYVATWVDDMRSSLHVGEGQWNPATQTMTYRWSATAPGGQPMAWRETTEVVSENQQVFRILFPGSDGRDFEMMRAVYRRA